MDQRSASDGPRARAAAAGFATPPRWQLRRTAAACCAPVCVVLAVAVFAGLSAVGGLLVGWSHCLDAADRGVLRQCAPRRIMADSEESSAADVCSEATEGQHCAARFP